MKILIIGKTGFIGSHLVEALSEKHNVVSPSKNELNLVDSTQVYNFLNNNKFDLIINTAIVGGKTGNTDDSKVLYDNLAMTFNLLKFKQNNTKIFNFTSGYELDKNTNHPGSNEIFFNCYPLDYYGMSKNIISRIYTYYPDVYTFRLFGVYGNYEKDNRFIKRNIINYIKNQPINIIQDRYLDFIFVDDIVKVIEYYITNINNNLEHFIDLTIPKKYKLTEVANVINSLDKNKVEIIVNKDGFDLDYIGNSEQFVKILPNYTTLEEGIKKVYNYINKKL
jgi:GDP-L-fucose synthase